MILAEGYQSNIDDNIWNTKAYINFMENIAGTISEKIKDKVESLSGC